MPRYIMNNNYELHKEILIYSCDYLLSCLSLFKISMNHQSHYYNFFYMFSIAGRVAGVFFLQSPLFILQKKTKVVSQQ